MAEKKFLIGMYPGTFDPITNGHLDIITRAAKILDRLIIGVAVNEAKKPLFALDERVKMVEDLIAPIAAKYNTEIIVKPFDNLLMHFAEQVEANVIVRGLRAVADFEYEYQMVGMNSFLNDDIETLFLMADAQHQAIASRLVKEIAKLGGDISQFVPPAVAKQLLSKFSND